MIAAHLPRRLRLPLAAIFAACCALPAAAQATPAVPGEVVVKREGEQARVLTGVTDVDRTVARACGHAATATIRWAMTSGNAESRRLRAAHA